MIGAQSCNSGDGVVLDNADEAVADDIKAAWRVWLHLSNLLGLRLTGTNLTVRSLAGDGAAAPASPGTAGDGVQPDSAWGVVIDEATEEERVFLTALSVDGAPVPEYGPELDGIPLGPSWMDRKITVDVGLDEDERGELTALGWTVVDMDVDEVRDALKAGES